MNYYIDTEFHEYKKKTKLLGYTLSAVDTIELISIGIVNEAGKEYYAICNEFDLKAAWNNEWLRENVLKNIHDELYRKESVYSKTYHYDSIGFNINGMRNLLTWHGKTKKKISEEIINFVGDDRSPEFYGYYADYDWVVLCWLFGRMIDLPGHFPMFCFDLKQMMATYMLGKSWKDSACPDPIGQHNALVDAQWNKKLHAAIIQSR